MAAFAAPNARPLAVSRANFSVAVYLVTDRRVPAGRTVEEIVAAALHGDGQGNAATIVQLRDKQVGRESSLAMGRALREVTAACGAAFVVNDDVSLALAVGADGVHLGQEDESVSSARAVLGAAAIVGVSAGTRDEARKAVQDGADYVGVGAVFRTGTKSDAGEPIGVRGLAEVVDEVGGRISVVAIGGVDVGNAGACCGAGADGVAVISAVMNSDKPGEVAAQLARIVKGQRESTRDEQG